MERHFTATAFVVHGGKTLLHWHRKLGQWMPPGGHLLPGEDPLSGALREALEETGIRVEPVATAPHYAFDYPEQVAPPQTILIEDITEPDGSTHKHIDFIYFCRSLDGEAYRAPGPGDELIWTSEAQLEAGETLPRPDGSRVAVAEDVRILALEAIRQARGEAS